MSARRVFSPKTEREEGRLRSVYRLTCRECGSQQPKLVCTAKNGAYPPEMIVKNLQNKGWEVGKRDGDDLCPSCVNRKQEQRRRLRLITNETEVNPMSAEPAPLAPYPQSKPEPEKPRDPTITETLIILAKLEEVFDEKTGYINGMTDAKVAADLNCPRAWVADVRRGKFGEAGSNEEIREFLEKARNVGKMLESLRNDFTAFLARQSDLTSRFKALEADVASLARRAADVEGTIR